MEIHGFEVLQIGSGTTVLLLNCKMNVTQENDSGLLVKRNSRKLGEIWVLIYISNLGKIRF